MIKVAVAGCAGRMGQAVVDAVNGAEDMQLVCGIDPYAKDGCGYPVYAHVADAIKDEEFDVMIDFTQPDVVEGNIRVALPAGVDCVIGTTGLANDTLEELAGLAPEGTCLFVAPNFTVGAVLMMRFAEMAAPYLDEAEVIEFHHAHKKDAPSGTAKRTAEIIAAAWKNAPQVPGRESELPGCEGARGAEIDGVPVNSVRSMGYVASQEVVFGSMGQSLSIRHDSWDRTSYMPGVLLAVRNVRERSGLIVGLEHFMF
jgi:4-hydroxy-tetrahydrodipicolinate reductase